MLYYSCLHDKFCKSDLKLKLKYNESVQSYGLCVNCKWKIKFRFYCDLCIRLKSRFHFINAVIGQVHINSNIRGLCMGGSKCH